MTKTLRLRIVTPERTILDEQVVSLRFHGINGDYGILANHAPMMTATEPGVLSYDGEDGQRVNLVLTDGFAEVRDNVVSIICEAGENAVEVDVERARKAEQRARERLADRASLASEDVIRAEASLRRAMARQLGVGRRAGGRADM